MAASGLIFITVMAGTWWRLDRQARDHAAVAALAPGDARLLCQQARREPPSETKLWNDAVEAMKRAAPWLKQKDSQAELAALLLEAGRAQEDGAHLKALAEIRSWRGLDRTGSRTDAAYARAFLMIGVDVDRQTLAAQAAVFHGRPRRLVAELAAFLDDWAACPRSSAKASDRARVVKLSLLAREVDPDPYRDRLRMAIGLGEPEQTRPTLKELAKDPVALEQPVQSVGLLAETMMAAGDHAEAAVLLRSAQRKHPRDVWFNLDLATSLRRMGRTEEAIRFYSIARALQPEIAHDLGHALHDVGRDDEAIDLYRELNRLRPKVGRHFLCLGSILADRGDEAGARAASKAAAGLFEDDLRTSPDDHGNLGNLAVSLMQLGDLDEAIARQRNAIRLKPDDAAHHANLATMLSRKGDKDGELAEYREAIRLDPEEADLHASMASILAQRGDADSAMAEALEAIRLKPDLAKGHHILACILYFSRGMLVEAMASFREAARLQPDDALVFWNLGRVLALSLDFRGAANALRTAVRLRPENLLCYSELGSALQETGELSAAGQSSRRH